MYCVKCGKSVTDDQKFCIYCGNKLDNNHNINDEKVKNKKKIKSISIVLICVTLEIILMYFILMLFCPELRYSPEGKAKIKAYHCQGEDNAKKFIKSKYGFDAEVISSFVEKKDTGPVIDFTPAPTGDVEVYMKYNDKEFKVLINAKTDSIESGQDDYQYEEISKDILDYIYTLTGTKPYKYYLSYNKSKNSYKICNLTKEYYTGDNILECTRFINLVVSYIDNVDLEKLKDERFEKFENDDSYCSIILVQYKSKEAYDNTERLYKNSEQSKYNVDGTISYDSFKSNSQNLEKVFWRYIRQNNYYNF